MGSDGQEGPCGAKAITRRNFLSTAGRGLIGTGAGLLVFSRAAGAVSANDKIVVGHIGVGGMGNAHVSWFASHADVETAAICDVDETRRLDTLKRLQGMRPDTRARPYADFREVLDRPDIDVITCATPDHWHALVTILAFQAGKDVYSEKPLSHSFAESSAMLAAGQRYGRVFQLGTQIHAGDNYHRVVELIRAGVIGKVHTARAWKNGGSPGLGYPPDQPPPPTLNYDMWLGPAPWRPYNPARCFFNFRYFWDYSAGVYADFWCHIMDLVFWALEPKGLRSIEARGEEPHDGLAETPQWIDVDYEFEDLRTEWRTDTPDVPGAAGRGIGAQFVGTEGSLVADYGTRLIFRGGQELTDVREVPWTLPSSPGHQRNFLDCVKSRALTESNLAYARRMTVPMYLGAISFRLRRKLTWDPEREEFIGDDAANRMLSRPYRAPWWLPG
jgi:predicted dehydrogenase